MQLLPDKVQNPRPNNRFRPLPLGRRGAAKGAFQRQILHEKRGAAAASL
jgi:hypothetical protein